LKILVTGGAGFIGSHTVDALVSRGDEVIVVDNLSTGEARFLDHRVRFEQADTRGPEAADLVRRERPDAICHLAAQMSISLSVRDPLFDFEVNLMASLRLLIAAAETKTRFVFASSGGGVYGNTKLVPTPENAPCWPIAPYGVSKLSFEHYLFAFRAQTGLDYTVLRYANVYGPRQNPNGEAGVVAIFAHRLIAGEPCVINGSGTDTRDYVHVADVVAANLLALDSNITGTFNVGTGEQTATNQIYEWVARALDSPAKPIHGPARSGDLRASAIDYALIQKTLGWHPSVPLGEGIRETVEWFRADGEHNRSQADR
jgi:UDP-glucose 4-epimerase